VHCLASHPAAEARLLAEVDALGSEVSITAEHLPRLLYTEAVLMETLRLHPPGAFIIRESRTPVEARAPAPPPLPAPPPRSQPLITGAPASETR
jgi:cytochrome P450